MRDLSLIPLQYLCTGHQQLLPPLVSSSEYLCEFLTTVHFSVLLTILYQLMAGHQYSSNTLLQSLSLCMQFAVTVCIPKFSILCRYHKTYKVRVPYISQSLSIITE